MAEVDGCTRSGEIGALLRREGLHSSHLAAWRGARGELDVSTTPRKRGPKPKQVDPNAKRVAELEREIAKLKARAERAEFPRRDTQKSMRAPFFLANDEALQDKQIGVDVILGIADWIGKVPGAVANIDNMTGWIATHYTVMEQQWNTQTAKRRSFLPDAPAPPIEWPHIIEPPPL